MYGLSSRKSLAQRRIQWGPPSDTKKKDSGLGEAQLHPSNTFEDDPLFETGAAPSTSGATSSSTSGATDKHVESPEISPIKTSSKVEIDSQLILDAIHQQAANLNQQMTDLNHRLTLLDGIHNQGTDLTQKVSSLERQICALSEKIDQFNSASLCDRLNRIESILDNLQNRAVTSHEHAPQPSSTPPVHPGLEQISDGQNFVPFFINETLIGRDNKTSLVGTNLEIVVEILGGYPNDPLIYPFGSATNVPAFEPTFIQFTFTDANEVTGTIEGAFRRDEGGLYVIEITDIEALIVCTLPLKLTGTGQLTCG